jgi:hypothetical protein
MVAIARVNLHGGARPTLWFSCGHEQHRLRYMAAAAGRLLGVIGRW